MDTVRIQHLWSRELVFCYNKLTSADRSLELNDLVKDSIEMSKSDLDYRGLFYAKYLIAYENSRMKSLFFLSKNTFYTQTF